MVIRTRVNGSLLVKFINKPVSIIGTITNVNALRKTFTIKTSDNQLVNVICQKPLDELDGLVEVHGIVQGKSMIACDYYLVFHSQLAETYGKLRACPIDCFTVRVYMPTGDYDDEEIEKIYGKIEEKLEGDFYHSVLYFSGDDAGLTRHHIDAKVDDEAVLLSANIANAWR